MTLPAFDAPRNYLFVSAGEPVGAAEALWSWRAGPPELCVISPSREALDTARFASAGHFVSVMEEPLLVARVSRESANDFAARFAGAVRIVLAFDIRAALVVCDELPDGWETPLAADGRALRRRADLTDSAAAVL